MEINDFFALDDGLLKMTIMFIMTLCASYLNAPCITYLQYRLRAADINSLFYIPQPVLRVCLSI